MTKIPSKGKVFLVRNGIVREPEIVSQEFQETLFLRNQKVVTRGWLLEILKCLDKIEGDEFGLEQIYAFESYLKTVFPKNNHIKDKIRQQLQFLRDADLIEFLGRGRYRKK